MVIIAVREVKSAIIVVVSDVVVNHDYGSPGVENGVGDDGSKGRTADHIVAIEVAGIDTVVEVVGDAVVVNRSDAGRNVHVLVVVVVIRVYVGSVGVSSGACARASRSGMTGISRMTGVAARSSTAVVVALVAGASHRLRLSLTFLSVSASLRDSSRFRICGGGRTGSVDGCIVGRLCSCIVGRSSR